MTVILRLEREGMEEGERSGKDCWGICLWDGWRFGVESDRWIVTYGCTID